MADFFPTSFYSPDTSFTPLFRLLDDFDSYSREVNQAGPGGQAGGRGRRGARAGRIMTPSFDVRETENAYDLYGELPGVDKKDVEITFTEPQTVVVKGRVERSYQAGTPPAGLVEGGAARPAISEAGEEQQQPQRRATVEEEGAEQAVEKGQQQQQQREVAKQGQQQQQQQPGEKFWISERSVGEFSRIFNFPTRVDTNNVTAKLEHGILQVTVPKLKDQEPQRITIS